MARTLTKRTQTKGRQTSYRTPTQQVITKLTTPPTTTTILGQRTTGRKLEKIQTLNKEYKHWKNIYTKGKQGILLPGWKNTAQMMQKSSQAMRNTQKWITRTIYPEKKHTGTGSKYAPKTIHEAIINGRVIQSTNEEWIKNKIDAYNKALRKTTSQKNYQELMKRRAVRELQEKRGEIHDQLGTSRKEYSGLPYMDSNYARIIRDNVVNPQNKKQKPKEFFTGMKGRTKEIINEIKEGWKISQLINIETAKAKDAYWKQNKKELEKTTEKIKKLSENPSYRMYQLSTGGVIGTAILPEIFLPTFQAMGAVGTGYYGSATGEALLKKNYETAGEHSVDFALNALAAKEGIRGVKQRILLERQPTIIETADYPRLPREETLNFLKTKEGQRIPTLHGKSAGKEIYISEPRYAGTQGTKGYFTTPESSQYTIYMRTKPNIQNLQSEYIPLRDIPVMRGGQFTLNPWRNPSYWPKKLTNLIKNMGKESGGKGTNLMKGAKLKNQEWHITYPEVQTKGATQGIKEYYSQLSKKAGNEEIYGAIAPKTLRKWTQPEAEVFNVATQQRIKNMGSVKIGYTADGTPIKVDFPKKGFVQDIVTRAEIKAKAKGTSLQTQLNEYDIVSKDISERAKTKWKYIENNDPKQFLLDNSPKAHSDAVSKNIKILEEKNNIQINEKIGKAFAEVHDINKEQLINYDVNHHIADGITKGYYDYIPSVKQLTPQEKATLAKTIYYDERPPVNPYNLMFRQQATMRNAATYLTDEQKLIINADRLARFGKKADPNMIYKIGNNEPIIPETIFKTKEYPSTIRNIERIRYEKEYKKTKELPYDEYIKKEKDYDTYQNYSRKYKFETKKQKEETNKKEKYDKKTYTPKEYITSKYTYTPTTYRTYTTTYEPTPIDYTTTYTKKPLTETTKYTTTYTKTPTTKTTLKPQRRDDHLEPAWLVKTGNKGKLDPTIIVETQQEAMNAGRDIVDEGPQTEFTIKKIKTNKQNINKWQQKQLRTHKFTRYKSVYSEKKKYRRDSSRENSILFKALSA